MPNPGKYSAEIHAAIRADIASGLTNKQVMQKYKVSNGFIYNLKNNFNSPKTEPAAPEPTSSLIAEPEPIDSKIRDLLKKAALTTEELADVLDCGPSKVKAALGAMQARGVMLMQTAGGVYGLKPSFAAEPGKSEVISHKAPDDAGWTHVFGVTTDNHLCNKHSRLDVLNAAYDHFEREGITRVFNCGNWVDGEARFNKTELITRPGMDAQLEYMIDVWPVKKDIITEYIAGDDHEGWYQQREGVEVGRYLQLKAEAQGRNDLKYLGYGEADVKLTHGSGSAVMRLVHPGGGSSYAISYTDQKRVESYSGGEKPNAELAGHYHKFNIGYPREVWTAQCGTTCDQSMFMRKKRLQAHVGYAIIKIRQDETGALTGFAPEWFPFYDRGYYEHRF
jgi:hypothetical protein